MKTTKDANGGSLKRLVRWLIIVCLIMLVLVVMRVPTDLEWWRPLVAGMIVCIIEEIRTTKPSNDQAHA